MNSSRRPRPRSPERPSSAAAATGTPTVRRLTTGWEHYHGGLGGVWEVWRGKVASDNVTWDAVAMPHCFNAWDAVDPDHAYYEGPGWYRTSLAPLNPCNAVRFAIAGDGELIQNLGTSTGSRQVELYNGRAIIRARMQKGEAAVTVSAEKLPTALLTVTG